MTEADRQKDRQGQTETETRTKQENESYEMSSSQILLLLLLLWHSSNKKTPFSRSHIQFSGRDKSRCVKEQVDEAPDG